MSLIKIPQRGNYTLTIKLKFAYLCDKASFSEKLFLGYTEIFFSVGVAFTESPWRLRTASTENNTKGVAFYYCQFHLKPPSIVSTCGS